MVAISVMVPHFSSELLEVLVSKQLENCIWPEVDQSLAELNNVEIAIQINGKLRATVKLSKGLLQDVVESEAKIKVENWLIDKKVIKIIFVQDRLINFVVK